LRWPGRALQMLLRNRTAQPSRLFLLAAAGVGVLLGVIAQVTLDWLWWLVAALWLAVVWLVFLATALHPSGRDELWIELARTVHPAVSAQLEERLLLRHFQRAPGPVYGLFEWDGLRSIGGHGRSSSSGLTRLEVRYGDPLEPLYGDPPGEPLLRVESTWHRPGRPDIRTHREREHLVRAMWHHQVRPPADLDPGDLRRWAIERHREIDRQPIPGWAPTQFAVEGTPRIADIYTEGEDWVALVELEDSIIKIESHRIPAYDVALARVKDLSPYVDGTRQLNARAQKGPPPNQSKPGP
jgi:hypothetical protein